MKNLIRSFALASTFIACSLGSFTAHAQIAKATAGNIGISLNPPFVNQLASVGVGLTFGPNQQFKNGYPIFLINGGIFDLASAAGELGTEGGFVFGNSKAQYQARRFTLDSTGPVAVISAVIYINGKDMGRQPFFDLQYPTPLPPQHIGTIEYTNIGLTLHPSMRDMINNSFGTSLAAGNTDALLSVEVTFSNDTGPQ